MKKIMAGLAFLAAGCAAVWRLRHRGGGEDVA